jgi:ribose/xylose/arabinose/galactoside ABC-type transport system permease subunit
VVLVVTDPLLELATFGALDMVSCVQRRPGRGGVTVERDDVVAVGVASGVIKGQLVTRVGLPSFTTALGTGMLAAS